MAVMYNPNVWFSPRFAIYNLWAILKDEGDHVKKTGKYQKEREAWILGVTLLGIKKMYGELWWLKIPQEDPPDLMAMTVTPDEEKNRNVQNYREVEIMEFTDFSKVSVIEEIVSKLKNKRYIRETALVIYLRKDMKVDIESLSKEISLHNINVADVWLVGNTKIGSNNFLLFSIYPNIQRINFNLDEEINLLPLGNRIEMIFGKGMKMELEKSVPITQFNPKSEKQWLDK